MRQRVPWGSVRVRGEGGGGAGRGDEGGGKINVYDVTGMEAKPVRTISRHPAEVKGIWVGGDGTAVSGDEKGFVEVWDGGTTHDLNQVGEDLPANMETWDPNSNDLRALARKKNGVVALEGPRDGDGKKFAVYGSDRRIRVFDRETMKITAKYSDAVKNMEKVSG